MFICIPNTDHYTDSTKQELVNACGLIPQFFVVATRNLDSANEDIETLADAMDSLYNYGGFSVPFEGTVSDTGVYSSQYEEDEDLQPYATLYSRGYTCYIYPYAITAIVRDNGDTKIGRFD
jgi:hypothetical protein